MTPLRGVQRVGSLALLSAGAKAPGFLIPIVIAALFGANASTDAYFLAYGGFLIAGASVGASLETTVVPYAARALALGRSVIDDYLPVLARHAVRYGVIASLGGLIIVAASVTFVPPAGIRPGDVVTMYLLMVPAAIASSLAAVYTGTLSASGKLELSVLGNAFRGVGVLAGAVASALVSSLLPLAAGLSVGECARVLWIRNRCKAQLANVPQSAGGPAPVGFLLAANQQIAAQSVLTFIPFVERLLIGGIALAAISHVEYAVRLTTVAAVLFDGAIAPLLLVRWSTLQAQNNLPNDWPVVYRPLVLAALTAAAVSATIALAAGPIVSILLQRGAFSEGDAFQVSALLRWYSVSLLFTMTALCVERLMLARGQTGKMLKLGIVRAAVRLVVLGMLVPSMGLLALPAAYATADAVYLASLLYWSRQPLTVRA